MTLWEFFNGATANLAVLVVIIGTLYQLATFRVKGELSERIKKYSLFQKSLFYLTAILIILCIFSLIMAGVLHPK